MAYVDRSSNTRRTTTAIAVAAIQAGVIYAVATGLAVQFIDRPEPNRTETYDVEVTPITPDTPDTPKPPIGPKTTTQRNDDRITTVDTTILEPTDTGLVVDAGPIDFPSGGGGTTIVELPKPEPTPLFTPRAAKPRNAPGSWATTNDYPTSDMRQGNQGLTRFRLSVGTDGRVMDCQVTGSSGFASLDRATCDKVSSRARFEPATDSSGAKVPGTYSGSIRWQIPD